MAAINFILGQPPKKAIEWLQSRGVSVKNYRQMAPHELAKALTIARISDLDMLQSINNELINSAQKGLPYAEFKKAVMDHFYAAGWVHKGERGQAEIIDINTGEVFGSPRRLENIYRTNTQTALMVGQYRTYMENIDNRPYFQYTAVGDARTRPAHLAMSGLVYRYDDPFWATFYPPNGFGCRCSVISLSERDIGRRDLKVSRSTEANLVEVEKAGQAGTNYTTIAYKTADGRLISADQGFNYNAGRMNYRPNLDLYKRELAHEFAKADMRGAEFKSTLKQLYQDQAGADPARHGVPRHAKFAAGVFSENTQELMQCSRATVWLSDEALLKQIESGSDQNLERLYADLPEVIYQPEHIFLLEDNRFFLTKQRGEQWLVTVIEHLTKTDELFVQSHRLSTREELANLVKNAQQLK